MKSFLRLVLTIAMTVTMQGVLANDQLTYETRVGSDLAVHFTSLDRDHDAQVSREEAAGDVYFMAVFNDIDANRDGVVTRNELSAYLNLRFGAHAADAARQAFTARADTPLRVQ
jgi:hypothetical protein